jgi:hypothetical protein
MSILPASPSTHASPFTRVPGPRDLAGFHRDVLQLLKNYPAVFIALPVLLHLPFEVALSFFTRAMGDDLMGLRFALRGEQIISAAVGTLTVSTLLQAVRMVGAGQSPTMGAALSAGFQTWGKVFGATLTTGFVIFLGFLCLFIPGAFLTSRYAMVLPAVVDGLSGKEARAHSSNLVKEHGTLTMLWWLMALGVSWYALPLFANLVLGVAEGVVPGLVFGTVTGALGSAVIDVVAAGLTVFSAVVYGELSGKSELSPVGLELIDSNGRHVPAPRSSGAATLAVVAVAGAMTVLVSLTIIAFGVWAVADAEAYGAFLQEHPAFDVLARFAE